MAETQPGFRETGFVRMFLEKGVGRMTMEKREIRKNRIGKIVLVFLGILCFGICGCKTTADAGEKPGMAGNGTGQASGGISGTANGQGLGNSDGVGTGDGQASGNGQGSKNPADGTAGGQSSESPESGTGQASENPAGTGNSTGQGSGSPAGDTGTENGTGDGSEADGAGQAPKITPEVTVTPEELAAALLPEVEVVDVTKVPYTYTELCEDILLLEQRYPEIFSVEWAGYSADMRPIPVITFGNPAAGQTVLVQAAIHGRESLTTLLVMKLLEQYARDYDTATYGGRTYRNIFSEVALLVVPMSNPDGVSISQLGTDSIRSEELRTLVEGFYGRDGAGMNRDYFYSRYKANANGVDLNRNFAYGWEEYKGTSVPAADHYKGKAPASEPETRLLMELTKSVKPVAAVSYHATGSLLYWDFGQEGELRERCLSLVELVHNLTGYPISYAATDPQDAAGYCEWAVGVQGIPEVTIEIGTVAAPLPISEFPGVWSCNREVLAAVAYKYLVEEKRAGYLGQ